MRLNQIARQLNISTETIVSYLATQGIAIDHSPNTKLNDDQLALVAKQFPGLAAQKPGELGQPKEPLPPPAVAEPSQHPVEQAAPAGKAEAVPKEPLVVPPQLLPPISYSPAQPGVSTPLPGGAGAQANAKFRPTSYPQAEQGQFRKPAGVAPQERTRPSRPTGERPLAPPTVPGQTPLSSGFKPSAPTSTGRGGFRRASPPDKAKKKKQRQDKKQQAVAKKKLANKKSVLRVTEFITPFDLAPLLKISVNDLVDICAGLGLTVSTHQRLDAEIITVIAHERNKEVEFIPVDTQSTVAADVKEGALVPRPPVVMVTGHVDHGKTSLLDYIRKTRVAAQEAGGITQHIGAYEITTTRGDKMVFLDTPGHAAFTAMRARGAQVADIAIIVIAADDGVMAQTKEAISHIQQAGVPMVIAINKIDKKEADPDKVRKGLSYLNIQVEEWGGKYQCQEISATTGQGVEELLEKVLLESDLLELKANPVKKGEGTILEASLEKARGYLATALVQQGTLRTGDTLLAGPYFGKIKAMFTAQGAKIKEAGPATPVQVLGLNGAPDAGQKFRVAASEQEARAMAAQHQTIFQEQKLRAHQGDIFEKTKKKLFDQETPTTLLNIVIKGDTQGSVEALADALLQLSTDEMATNIILKSVGDISESDVLLASSTQAMIIGFNVKTTPAAKAINEREGVNIALYNIIYHAIDYVQGLIQKTNQPTAQEVVVGKAAVLKVFTISRVGNIAGCQVKQGTIKRKNHVRVVRNEEVIYTGPIRQLKREKEVIKEAKEGSECGIHIEGFQDIREGDVIQSVELISR